MTYQKSDTVLNSINNQAIGVRECDCNENASHVRKVGFLRPLKILIAEFAHMVIMVLNYYGAIPSKLQKTLKSTRD